MSNNHAKIFMNLLRSWYKSGRCDLKWWRSSWLHISKRSLSL